MSNPPVCVRVCRLSNEGRSNIFPHTSHVQDLRLRRLLLFVHSSALPLPSMSSVFFVCWCPDSASRLSIKNADDLDEITVIVVLYCSKRIVDWFFFVNMRRKTLTNHKFKKSIDYPIGKFSSSTSFAHPALDYQNVVHCRNDPDMQSDLWTQFELFMEDEEDGTSRLSNWRERTGNVVADQWIQLIVCQMDTNEKSRRRRRIWLWKWETSSCFSSRKVKSIFYRFVDKTCPTTQKDYKDYREEERMYLHSPPGLIVKKKNNNIKKSSVIVEENRKELSLFSHVLVIQLCKIEHIMKRMSNSWWFFFSFQARMVNWSLTKWKTMYVTDRRINDSTFGASSRDSRKCYRIILIAQRISLVKKNDEHTHKERRSVSWIVRLTFSREENNSSSNASVYVQLFCGTFSTLSFIIIIFCSSTTSICQW